MKYTNKHNLPKTLFECISKDVYDIKPSQVNMFSVTSLLNDPKSKILFNRHIDEVEEDVSNLIWSLLGTSVHATLDRLTTQDRILEKRFYLDYIKDELVEKKETKPDTIYVTGQCDVYEKDTLTVLDYKVTSVWAVLNVKKEWEEQLNCYAYFYRRAGYFVNKLGIVAILKDWNKRSSTSPKYPNAPACLIKIPLWSMDKQKQFIKDKMKLHLAYLHMEDDDIPECSPMARWRQKDVWAVVKNDAKKATKLFDNEMDAMQYGFARSDKSDKDVYNVQFRKAVDRKCQEYCKVNSFCNYYKDNYDEQGKLK